MMGCLLVWWIRSCGRRAHMRSNSDMIEPIHQPHKVRWGNWFKRFLSHFVAGDVLRHWLAHHDIDNPSHTPFHRELKNEDTSVHSVSKGSSIFYQYMIINVIVIIMVFMESRPLWSFGQHGTLNSSTALPEMFLLDYHHPNPHPHCQYHNHYNHHDHHGHLHNGLHHHQGRATLIQLMHAMP